jgi:hypothetical protein
MCTPDSSHATRCRVSQRVHTNARHARRAGSDLDHPQQISRVDGSAKVGGEHQTAVLPRVGRSQSFGVLGCPVLAQHRNDPGESGTVRRERAVLGSLITSWPSVRPIVAATFSVPASRSTRSHASASASPFRRPVDAISTSADGGCADAVSRRPVQCGSRRGKPAGIAKPTNVRRTNGMEAPA